MLSRLSSSLLIMSDPTWTKNIQRSCFMVYFHFVWGLGLVILGWATFAARWIPKIKPYHRTMGQIWVYGMIIQIYTSTYASYNGFRWFIFMFGIIAYGSLIIGHSMIRKHQLRRRRNSGDDPTTKMNYVPMLDGGDTPKTQLLSGTNPVTLYGGWFTQKQLKTLHGIFMTISLIMVTGAGAAFTTRFSSTQECKNIYCPVDGDGSVPECFTD